MQGDDQQYNMRWSQMNSNQKSTMVEGLNTQQQLREAGFQFSTGGVPFRRVQLKDRTIGCEIKFQNQLINVRTGSDYLGEGMRTIQLQMRDILTDLYKLDKIIKTKQFQQLNPVLP